MNRVELRQEIKNLLAWDTSPTDTTANARLNEAILRGFDMLASACPSAIIPRLETISIPSATAYSSTTLSTTSDNWVLQFDGPFTPAVDKTWDKLMWLEVTLPVTTGPGRTNRYQCREFWYNNLVGKYFVSLDRPWKDGTLSALAWTLVPLYVWLPNDITTIQSVMRYGATGGALELKTITQAVTQNKVRNVFQSTSGFPSEIRRDAAQQMIAPLYAPPVEVDGDTTWGNEPYGRFQYAFTYCSGYRSLNLTSQGGTPTPWQESAPSPVSAEVTISDGTHNVKVTLPDIAWEQGFGDGGTLRFSHSGIYKRLYRKRLTVGGGSNPNIESPEVFQFIADIDDRQTFFIDDGSIVPDRSVRMPERQGYFGWSLYPTPTDYTEMDFRYTIRPRRLENDADVPEFDPMYSAALCLMAASWQAYRDADAPLGKHLQAEAMTNIQRLQSTQSSPTGRISRKGMGGYDTAFYPGVFRNVP
jgi:hypothetical protein